MAFGPMPNTEHTPAPPARWFLESIPVPPAGSVGASRTVEEGWEGCVGVRLWRVGRAVLDFIPNYSNLTQISNQSGAFLRTSNSSTARGCRDSARACWGCYCLA